LRARSGYEKHLSLIVLLLFVYSSLVTSIPAVEAQLSLRGTVSADPSTVDSGGSSTIRVAVTTSDGSKPTVRYSWTATGGSLNSTTSNPVTWIAPKVSYETTYRISVTVSASGYTSYSGFADVIVKPPFLRGTVSADPSTVDSGGSSTIRVAVTTSDGSSPALQYSWTATGGSLNSTSRNPVSWRAPTVSSQATYRISVTVSASGYTSYSGYVNVTVAPKSLQCTVSADPGTVRSGGSSTVRATVTVSDGSSPSVSYSWTATGGSLSSTTGNPVTWTAPSASSQTTYRISVTVSASGYTQGSNYVDITVAPKDLVTTSLTITLSPSQITENTRATIAISGRLTRADTGAGIADKSVSLEWTGGSTTKRTDANGYYSHSTDVAYKLGTYQFTVRFDGTETGSTVFKSSSSSANLSVQVNVLPVLLTLIALIFICAIIGFGLHRRRMRRRKIAAAPPKPPVMSVIAPPVPSPPKPVTPPKPAKPTCPRCGTALPPGAKFCGKCGAKLG